MNPTKENVAAYFKANVDFQRFAKLTKAIGAQLNNPQLRFLKSFILERSIERYSNCVIKCINEEGCDFYIDELSARVEMKYTEDAIYTSVRKELRENTGNIKLMNSMGTNTHKELPSHYADFLLFIGNQAAILFDKPTLDEYVKIKGDGIIANIPTNKGIILATPEEMSAESQQELDYIERLIKMTDGFIDDVK